MSSDGSDTSSSTVNQSSYVPNESKDSVANSVIPKLQTQLNAKDKDFTTMPEQVFFLKECLQKLIADKKAFSLLNFSLLLLRQN